MVTDVEGRITQNVAYIPFGEVFVEERDGNWITPYLFNAKEMDSETGLYYYGARYLDPTAAMWMTVDPLFEKYPGMSPYNYCEGNPVKLVDPTGMGWMQNSETNEIVWNNNINSQEEFDKSEYNENYTYQGQEFMQAVSMGSTAGMMTEYYHSDGTISYHDYPNWLDIAKSYEGLREGNNPTIQAMIDNMNSDLGLEGNKRPIISDKDPWCGVFAYTCLKQAGLSVSKDKGWLTPARNDFYSKNWLEGQTIDKPVVGALAIMNYHHVAFVAQFDDKNVWIIGGNQSAKGAITRDGVEVNIKKYPRSLVTTYVIPRNMNLAPLGAFK